MEPTPQSSRFSLDWSFAMDWLLVAFFGVMMVSLASICGGIWSLLRK